MAQVSNDFSSMVEPLRGVERRRMPRYDSGAHLILRVQAPLRDGALVGPGYAHNISRGGVSLYTKHRLVPGQRVEVQIPLEDAGLPGDFPPQFEGVATVLRTRAIDSCVSAVVLRFDGSLADCTEYARYLELL